MKLKSLLIILVVWVSFSNAFAQRQNLRFSRLSLDKGLSQSSVHAVTQDSRDFLWVGTQDGLNRWDGYNFKIFKHIPNDSTSLTDSWVTALLNDSRKILWIGTAKGLDWFDPHTETFRHFQLEKSQTISLNDFSISSLIEDHNGIIWVGTKWGVIELDPMTGKQNRYILPDNSKMVQFTNNINRVYETQDNILWIGTNKGLYQLDRQRKEFISVKLYHPKMLVPNLTTIMSMYEDHNHNFWIGTVGDGLLLKKPEDNQWTFLRYAAIEPELSQISYIKSITEDKNNNLWLGSLNGNITQYQPETKQFQHYRFYTTDANGKIFDEIRTLYVDNSNILWIGSYGNGVNMRDLKPKKFNYFNHSDDNPNSLNSNDVWSITEDLQGNLWVGTNGGGINKFDYKTGKVKVYTQPLKNLSSDRANVILHDSKGRIWAGTRNYLNLYNPKKDKFEVYQPNGKYELGGSSIFCVFEDSKGFIWAGSNVCLNKIEYDKKKITRYQESATDSTTIFGSFIKTIVEDTNTDLWIGTGSGLNHYVRATDNFKRYKRNPKSQSTLNTDNVSSLYLDKDKNILWIGTTNGLSQYDRNKRIFRSYTERDGLPNSFIYKIIQDNQGNIWVSTNKGLSRIIPAYLDSTNEYFQKAFRNYDVSDGLQSNEFNRGVGFKSKSGLIYFGGLNGYNSFDPEKVIDNPNIPPIAITTMKISTNKSFRDLAIGDLNEITLSYLENNFSLEYSALDFTNTLKNQYAFRLLGFNDNWIYSGTIRTTTYTNLDPGEYIFQIKASNNDNIWNNEGTALKINIIPPLWKTKTAYTVYLLGFLLSIWWFIRWRTLSHRREKALLAKLVEEKTLELTKRTHELETSYEQLHQSQTYLIQTEKMASLGTLVAGIAHEINNPVNFISSSIMPLQRDLQDLLYYLYCYVEYHDLIKSGSDQQAVKQRINELENTINEIKETFDFKELKNEIDTLLKGIETGSTRTTEIIKGLRIFSRSDGKDLKEADIHEGINSTILLLSKEFGKRITIKKEYDDLPLVECFLGQLNQVFMNLLMNAVQAIEGEGTITITTMKNGNNVLLTFRDTGKGIDATSQAKIFDPFFSTKDVGKGTGLGLSISYGIIQKHGGSIKVSSEPDKGTQFVVTLPIKQVKDDDTDIT